MAMRAQLSPASSKTSSAGPPSGSGSRSPGCLEVEEVERRLPPTKRIPNNSRRRLLPGCGDDPIGLIHLSQKSDQAQARWSDLAEGPNGHELIVLEHDDNTPGAPSGGWNDTIRASTPE